jgi:Holliday junction resolvase RusA-like endonuclease
MQNKDFMETEARGYKAGLNPMMGEFSRKFCFAPVPHGSKKSHQFTEQIHKVLDDIKYVYFGEVKLDITLYLDEQKRIETPELADLDNYAKLICDSLKGPNGLLIDDTQVQSLLVSWIDTPESPYFEIHAKGHPDEFIMKPLALYEMSNGLFYPISPYSWTKDGIKKKTKAQVNLFLAALHKMTLMSKDFRQKLRQSGFHFYLFSQLKLKIDIKKAMKTINKAIDKRT